VEQPFDHHAVLLAEDSSDDATLMMEAWQTAGVPNVLRLVNDGEQTLAYLNGEGAYANRAEHPFPISLFLDLKLPRVDGLEVLATIKRSPKLRQLNVDILSASARSNDIEAALGLGANSYLVKPSRFESLVAMLKAWHGLARHRMFVVPPVPPPTGR
jgi:CheY-like chemotaxis protein